MATDENEAYKGRDKHLGSGNLQQAYPWVGERTAIGEA